MTIEKDRIIIGDAVEGLKTLPDGCVDMCVTSPPYYGLRDYGVEGQIGLEETPDGYIQKLVEVFREVKRVMKDDGTLWVNIGDTYNGNKKGNTETVKHVAIAGKQDFEKKLWTGAKNKDLIGIPWMLAFALRADGWYLRQDIIWHKPNPMPESVTDRCTKSHEYIFLLSKSDRYYFDSEAIKEESKWGAIDKRANLGRIAYDGKRRDGGAKTTLAQESFVTVTDTRNKRDVWSVATKPYSGAHFATYPEELIKPCILAGCPIGGVVLDPFFGAGTTGVVAKKLERYYIGTELNPEYAELAKNRIDYETDAGQIKMFEVLGI